MKYKSVVNLGVTSLQVILLTVLFVLEYLSGYKAGLAQHLYFKKIYYVSHFYQGTPLYLHGVLLLMLTALVIIWSKRSGKVCAFNLYKYLLLLTTLIICFLLPITRGLNIYAYLLIILQLCMLLEAAGLKFTKPNR